MGVPNICGAIQAELFSLPSTYEFKLKVNINARWLHLLKLGYVIVLGVILVLVYLTGGWNYKETGVSSVVIKLKGAGLSSGHAIWDSVDYVYPPQEVKAFFITTRAAITKQTQSICPDTTDKYNCTIDKHCSVKRRTEHGIRTGRCDKATGKCLINAWCPVQSQTSNTTKTALIRGADNFTVYVRNHEEYLKFGISRSNDPNSIKSSSQCRYHPVNDPTCPIFKIADVLKAADVKFEDVKTLGGVFQFYIKWHCYFNWNSGPCTPRYSFKRIAKDNTGQYAGYQMRYANYQEKRNKKERELAKVNGLRFLIMIKSTGEQFRITAFLSNFGSYLGYFGIWTFITGVLCGYFVVDKKDLLTLNEAALKRLVRNTEDEDDELNESIKKDTSPIEKIPLAISKC